MGDVGTSDFDGENEGEENGSEEGPGNEEVIEVPRYSSVNMEPGPLDKAVQVQEALDKGVQVPYIDSRLCNRPEEASAYTGSTKVSISDESSSKSTSKGNDPEEGYEAYVDDCLCQCDSAFDNIVGEESGVVNDQEGNLDDKLFVGALKVTTKQVTFTVYTVDDYEKVISESEQLTTRNPSDGFYEQNAQDIITLCFQVINRATYKLAKVDDNCVKKIQAMGITNQADSVVCWSSETRESICPLIISKDSRAVELLNDSAKRCKNRRCFINETGLIMSTATPAIKFSWLLQNNAAVKTAYQNHTLRIGTLDSWIIWNLTNGAQHMTDYTNASRTMLMNIQTLQWDSELMEHFGIDEDLLPEVKCNSEFYDKISNENCSLRGVNITASICIPNSALIGTSSIHPGNAIGFYDSGCTYVCVNMGYDFAISLSTNQTVIGYKISKNSPPVYAQESVVSGLGGAPSNRNSSIFPVTSIYVRRIDDSRYSIQGNELDRLTGRINNTLSGIRDDSGHKADQLTMVGDVAKNDLFMQTQANRSQVKTIRPWRDDPPAVGTAILAAHGEKLISMNDVAMAMITEGDKVFDPDTTEQPMDSDYDSPERDINEREESPPASGDRYRSPSERRSTNSTGSRSSGSGRGGGRRGGGGGGEGFPIKWDEIDLKSGCILLLIALALMILGHMIGQSFTKEPEVVYLRKCPR